MDERHGAPSTRVRRDAVAIKNIAFADVGHTSKGIVLYVEDASSSNLLGERCAELLQAGS
jgi:hypothetical protein